jgi:hypothetical protein
VPRELLSQHATAAWCFVDCLAQPGPASVLDDQPQRGEIRPSVSQHGTSAITAEPSWHLRWLSSF